MGPTVLQSQDQTNRFEFFNWLPDICSLWDQLFYSHRVKPVDLGFLFGSTISASTQMWDQLFYSHRIKPIDSSFLIGCPISALCGTNCFTATVLNQSIQVFYLVAQYLLASTQMWDQLFYSHRIKPVDSGFLIGRHETFRTSEY